MSIAEAETAQNPPALQSRRAPRRRFFNDMPDKGLFVLVAIAGFAAILFLKTHGVDPNYIASIAVALMIGYGVIAYHIPDVYMRLDRMGDNFYYLGFIYTLASLSSAIMQLQNSQDVNKLIGSFGIALVTTIVGIAGRVMFVQMKTDVDEIEDKVRRDLTNTAADLRGELLASIREFQTVRTAFAQTLEEMSAAFAKACETNTGKLDDLMQTAAKKLEDAFEPGRTGARQMNENMQAVAKSVEQATGRLSAVEIPSEKLNTQLEAFVEGLDAQLRRVATSVNEATHRASVPNEQLNAAVADFTTNLGTALKQLAHTVDKTRGRRRWYWSFRRRDSRSE